MISTWVVELIALGMLLFSVIDGWIRGLLMKVYGLVSTCPVLRLLFCGI